MDLILLIKKWCEPFGDELDTYLRRYRKISIKELSDKTCKAALLNR